MCSSFHGFVMLYFATAHIALPHTRCKVQWVQRPGVLFTISLTASFARCTRTTGTGGTLVHRENWL